MWTGTVPEVTLSLSSADSRHIKFIYFEKLRNFRSSLREFESRCDKSRDNWDIYLPDFLLVNHGCPLWLSPHVSRTVLKRFDMRCVCQPWDVFVSHEMCLSANQIKTKSCAQQIAKHGRHWLLKDNLFIILPKSASIAYNYALCALWEVVLSDSDATAL